MAKQRWIVVATKTMVWETEADSAEEALYHVQELIMPEELPEDDPDDYQFSVHEMEGRVVYPHQEQPAFLRKHDESTAELRRLREMLERLGDLSGLPKTPQVEALIAEINTFLQHQRRAED